MSSKTKKRLKFTTKKYTKKTLPSYIEVNGVVYEKITGKTGEVELDLSPNVFKLLREGVKKGHFVNEQEVVRSAIRELINS
jgi:macrodomain Ter protein organizer (MatP/YcbG family)